MKLCPRCSKELNESKFYTRSRGDLSGWCKKCTSLEASQRITKTRQDFKLKAIAIKGGKCKICGFNGYVSALALHHLDPSIKDGGMSTMKTKALFEKEIKKCILVCANCHMEIHEGLHPSILIYEPKITGQTKTRRKHKAQYVEYLGGACIDCGYNKCNRALNFHHRGEKEFTIGHHTQLPKLEKFKDELDKCDLLCANCHHIRHEKEQALPN